MIKQILPILLLLFTQQKINPPNVVKTISSQEIVSIAEHIYTNNISEIKDYSGLLVKRELIRGKDTGYQYIQFKFRENPKSIYLKFLKPRSLQNREVLYNQGQDVIVKRGGTFSPNLTVELDINSPLLTDDNRHTLNEIGVKVLSEQILTKLKNELSLPGSEVKMYDSAKVDGNPAILYKLIMSPETKEEANKTAEIAVDKKLNIPIYYRAINMNNKVVEEYLFRNLQINIGLTDKDFNENNDEYGFTKYDKAP